MKMPFGKFKDMEVVDLPDWYIEYLLKEQIPNGSLLLAMQKEMNKRDSKKDYKSNLESSLIDNFFVDNVDDYEVFVLVYHTNVLNKITAYTDISDFKSNFKNFLPKNKKEDDVILYKVEVYHAKNNHKKLLGRLLGKDTTDEIIPDIDMEFLDDSIDFNTYYDKVMRLMLYRLGD